MAKLYNLARMTTATTGTGTITLGSAVASYLSFASSGVQDGDTVTYAIVDGSNREIGRGVYATSGTTLTRTVLESTNSNTAINLSGSAEVFITAAGEDITSDVQITGGSITGITDLAVADGGTGQSTASAAANALDGYLPVTAAAGTTTLDNTSPRTIVVSGSTTQTIKLPDVTTLQLGWSFTIANATNSAVTIQSSGGNAYTSTLTQGLSCRIVCISTTGTTFASWSFTFIGSTGRTGTLSSVYSSSPTITSPTIAQINGGSAASSTLILQSTTGAGTTDAVIVRTGSQSERMRIDTAGNVGIGNISPAQKLDVTGSIKWSGATYENVFTITDGASVDLNPANGTIQVWTLGASRSPTATSFVNGQSMTLMVNDGTAYSITWPSVTWVGGTAPTLATTGYTIIELFEANSTLYGALVGSVA